MSGTPTLPPMTESSSPLGGQAREVDLLNGFLDWYRAVVENKVADLSLEDASRVMTPTGLSPLGIVKHLAYVEKSWFKARFAAEEEKVSADGAALDELSKSTSPHYGVVSLRWILVHMLEETARHAGHLDLMREQIDGKTGD